jgi:hypothetical protein
MHPELNLDLTIEMDRFPTIEKKKYTILFGSSGV